MRKHFLFSRIAWAVPVLFWATAAFAGKVEPVYKNGSGFAIKGYDPVAYFQQNLPVKGSPQFTHASVS